MHISLEVRPKECKSTESFTMEYAAAVLLDCKPLSIHPNTALLANAFAFFNKT